MTFSNEIFEQIWQDRYQKNGESYDDNLRRVARVCATNDDEENLFYSVMKKGYFFPAGRTMSNAGIGTKLCLSNCFVAPQIEDSNEDIFEKVKLGAITHQRGGGIGYDFSQLRPAGTPTSNDAIASGPISFMNVFNAETDTIQQGSRRGANMAVLSVYHMDIMDYIHAKSKDRETLKYFNLSVMVDDDFMNAVKNHEKYFVHHPVYDEQGLIIKDPDRWQYSKEIDAYEVWDEIMRMAYDNGEPGVLFYDTMNKNNPLHYAERIVGTNPCAEYLSGTVYKPIVKEDGTVLRQKDFGGVCNLGSLFLHRFVVNPFTEDAYIDKDTLSTVIHIAVRFLDNVIDINNFPDKIYKNYQELFRTIGLGVTGLADALAMLGFQYGSKECVEYTDELMDFISFCAYRASFILAEEKGAFPAFDAEQFINSGFMQNHIKGNSAWWRLAKDIEEYGIRNGKLISVAPTGTLSLVYGNNCSSGVEPIFSLEYERKVKIGGQSDENMRIVKISDPAWEMYQSVNSPLDKDYIFKTALELPVKAHVDMLAAVAKHVDMSVSKTINIPEEYSLEDTKQVYMDCYEKGIKGCTIFRPNALRQGILGSGSKSDKNMIQCEAIGYGRGDVIPVNKDWIGLSRKLTTGCGSLHCQAYFDHETGKLMQTFLSKGSSGGCNNFMIGLSRMMSYAARIGGDVFGIKDQLDSCGVCPSYAVRTATKHDTSKGACCPTAVGNALIDMHNQFQNEFLANIGKNPMSIDETKNEENLEKCPQCGEPLTKESHQSGCIFCPSCGWDKCG